MVKKTIQCPKCKNEVEVYRNPIPTVDIIIEIILIQIPKEIQDITAFQRFILQKGRGNLKLRMTH
jgi:hypothetical protein